MRAALKLTPEEAEVWTKEWPTEPGYYWFYGQPYAKTLYDPRLHIVTVHRTANESIVYLVEGSFMRKSAGVEGVWCPAMLPEPPCGGGGE